MATFGSQPGSWNFWWERESTQNQVATLATAPATGTVVSISCFVAGNPATSAPWNITFAMWDGGTGALLCQSSPISLSSGSGIAGGQSWITATVPNTAITNGHTYYIGFWHGQLTAIEWSTNTSSGSFFWQTASSLTTFSGASQSGALGAYATYSTPSTAGTFVRRSGAWSAAVVKVRRSGAWVTVDGGTGKIRVRRSGTWNP